ncbi:hypothetical protein G9A89_020056 [Geosiphon pyriformis]|nr:hypothetical protein G9A89_020056 [Geosiphon pyriformis]
MPNCSTYYSKYQNDFPSHTSCSFKDIIETPSYPESSAHLFLITMWLSLAMFIGATVLALRLLDKQGMINWNVLFKEPHESKEVKNTKTDGDSIIIEKKSIKMVDRKNGCIVLNVGGLKYVTLRSTLTSQPDTLLGTMFQERNEELLHPVNGNEYFIDRNGLAFHYILEYYRTGKIMWPDHSHPGELLVPKITREELEQEIDYFQIPVPISDLPQAHKSAAILLDEFIIALRDLAYQPAARFHNDFELVFYRDGSVPSVTPRLEGNAFFSLQRRFKFEGFRMLEMFGDEIGVYLKTVVPSLSWKLQAASAYDGRNIAGWRVTMSTRPLDRLTVLSNSCLVQDKFIP